ncbi:hypothetical protein ACHAXS_005771 [Conticribra weissflogii]
MLGTQHKHTRCVHGCLPKGRVGQCSMLSPSWTEGKVQKAILLVSPCHSNYFAMLFEQFSIVEHSTQTSWISLPNSIAKAFPAMLASVYANKPIQFTSHNAMSVQHLAHWLGICSLLKLTSTFVKFNFSLNTAAAYLSECLLYHDKHPCLLDGGTPPMEPCQTHPLLIQKPLPNSKLSNIILRYCWTQGDNTLSTFPCC